MKKKFYETPHTQHVEVELEEGVMTGGSVFNPEGGHDNGVSIEGHGYGNYGNYFDNPTEEPGWNDWD